MSQLSAACAPTDATLDHPVEHLHACHQRIEQRIEALERAAARFHENPDEARAVIAKSLRFLETNGAWHTEDEERSLFPRMVPNLASDDDRAFLAELAAQHDCVEAIVERLQATEPGSEDFAARAAEAARAYRDHIAFEDPRLLNLARAALSPADLAAIAAEMKRRRGL